MARAPTQSGMAEDGNDRPTRTNSLRSRSALVATLPAAAQDYPKKPIELVVPFVAGGTTDNIARLMAQRFSESWGQTVVVNNRAGGGSTIGTNAVAKAPPDGHTLLVTTIGFAINAGLQKLPYDPSGILPPSPSSPRFRSCWWCTRRCRRRICRSSSRWRSRSRAGGTTRPPAPARRRISPPRCSSRWPASSWCTCRSRAMPRP